MLGTHSRRIAANAGPTAFAPERLVISSYAYKTAANQSVARYTYRLVLQSRSAHRIAPLIYSINKIHDNLAQPNRTESLCLKPVPLLSAGMIKGPGLLLCASRQSHADYHPFYSKSLPTLLHVDKSAGPYFRINADSVASVFFLEHLFELRLMIRCYFRS